MSYIPSINIETNFSDDFNYIVTENSKSVLGNIVNNFNAGNHSFTYGQENEMCNDVVMYRESKCVYSQLVTCDLSKKTE